MQLEYTVADGRYALLRFAAVQFLYFVLCYSSTCRHQEKAAIMLFIAVMISADTVMTTIKHAQNFDV